LNQHDHNRAATVRERLPLLSGENPQNGYAPFLDGCCTELGNPANLVQKMMNPYFGSAPFLDGKIT
jgi:hypothetical protein